MNLEILRWLVRHRDVLTQAIQAVQKWDVDGSLLDKWSVIDSVARIVIPALEPDEVEALLDPWNGSDDVAAFALGAEAQALGLDWRTVVEVLLPLVIAILQALAGKTE